MKLKATSVLYSHDDFLADIHREPRCIVFQEMISIKLLAIWVNLVNSNKQHDENDFYFRYFVYETRSWKLECSAEIEVLWPWLLDVCMVIV